VRQLRVCRLAVVDVLYLLLMWVMNLGPHTPELGCAFLLIDDELASCDIDMDVFHVDHDFVIVAEYGGQFFKRYPFRFRYYEVSPNYTGGTSDDENLDLLVSVHG
jgi:hypothetical protein